MENIQDYAIDYVYTLIEGLSNLLNIYKLFAIGNFAYSNYLSTFSNAINASIGVYNLSKDSPLYWLHSLLLVILTGLSGGIIAPMLLGKPVAIVTNEFLIPAFSIAWYMTHTLGFVPLLEFTPIKLIWHVFMALYRTHSVISMVNVANSSLPGSEFYKIPIVGPIIVGALSGCMGQFMPFDKGLTVVSNGTSWAIQGAFITAAFYHIMVNDKEGPIGNTLRSAIGTYNDQDTRVIIFTMYLVTFFFQILFDKEANLFTPIHKLLYLVFQVSGPSGANKSKGIEDTVGWSYQTRLYLERFVEFLRVLIVIAAIVLHVYIFVPPTSLPSGKLLPNGESIATCQILSSLTNCKPFALTLEVTSNSNYRIVSYAGYSKEIANKEPIWSYNIKPNKSKLSDGITGLVLGEDGVLRLISRSITNKQDELLWSDTKSKCPVETSTAGMIYLTLSSIGQPVVVCADGTKVQII